MKNIKYIFGFSHGARLPAVGRDTRHGFNDADLRIQGCQFR
jgi:hypothetical protein